MMKKYLFFLVVAVLFLGCDSKPKNGELSEAEKQEKRDAFYSDKIKVNHDDDKPVF